MDSVKAACARGLVLAPVAALLLSVATLLLGNGLLGTLLIVRAGEEGFSAQTISAMMSLYFAGFTIGALTLPRMIVSVGHVRTFAGFAAIASMTALLHVAFVEANVWMPLRLVTGFAYAGMILATESWLNAHAIQSTRGQLLSIFGVVSMGSWALGQALLNIAPPADVTLFLFVSLLISAAVVPVTLLPSHPPAEVQQEPVAFRDLVAISPLPSVGVFLAGLAIGGFWGLGPNFAQRIGLDVGGISAFMAAVLGGTLVLQWPLGWLSDRVSRTLVIAGAALASAAAAIGVALAADAPLPVLLAAGALFGGFGIPIYSLCLAVANDDLPAGRLLGTARGLLLLNGIGTAAGPLIGGLVMDLLGPGGLFLYAAALLTALAVLAGVRRHSDRSVKTRATRCPSTAMIRDHRRRILRLGGDLLEAQDRGGSPMSASHWAVVGLLVVAAFAIRVGGLIAGERIRVSRQAWVLDELPGLIVVSLVASSLIGQPPPTWIAAGVALGAAIATNQVIVAMVLGMLAYAGLGWLGS